MQVVDVAEEVDFTRTKTVQAASDSFKRPGDVFFYSSPCIVDPLGSSSILFGGRGAGRGGCVA
eukprot:7793376-Lingulodinium_polyedra.AAC.1